MGLSMLLDMVTAGYGSRPALSSSGVNDLTFGDLSGLAEGGGGLLTSRKASHAVLLARNGPVFPTLLFAAAKAGVPLVPLNYRTSHDQLLDSLYQFESPLVVADDDYLPLRPAHLRRSARVPSLPSAKRPNRFARPRPGIRARGTPYTSGTTSRPKAAILRHRNLLDILSTVEFGAAAEDEAALVSVPPYHVAAIGSVLSIPMPADA